MDDERINFTIRILPELRTRLRFAHAQTGRTMEQLAEEALTELCDEVLHQEKRISGRMPDAGE
jgi:predicted DNA-binding protein